MKLNKKGVIVGAIMLLLIIAIVGSTIGREMIAGQPPGLLSFTLIHFAGYLFFLLMPVEALIPIYLAGGESAQLLIGISMATALVAQSIDFGIGYVVSDRVVDTFISRKKFKKFKKTFDRWGGWAIFTFNLFPLSFSQHAVGVGNPPVQRGEGAGHQCLRLVLKVSGHRMVDGSVQLTTL